MLTYVSGIRINVSTYLYTYIGHSLAIETLTNYNIYIKNDVYIMIISTIITIFIALLIFRKHGTFGTTKSNNRF